MAVALSFISLVLAIPFYWVILQNIESPNTLLVFSLLPLLFSVVSIIFVYIWTIKNIREQKRMKKMT